MNHRLPSRVRSFLREYACLAGALAVFLVLGLSLVFVKAPWCDEAWFANPAYNLAFHGKMSNNVLEPSGCFLNAYLRGVDEHSYLYVPNHIVALAAWFRLVGFSAYKARVYSVGWSVLALVAMYYILCRCFADRRVARLAVFLTAIDFIFLWSSADGRPEAVTNALMLCSIAAYLHFRERNIARAVWVSQVFAATATFAHPNALYVLVALLIVALWFDRERLRLRYLWLGVTPYAFFAGLWTIYIAQAPRDFMAQFFANVGYSDRWEGFLRPDLAIANEIQRHHIAYAVDGLWTGVMNGWMILIPFLYLAALVWLVQVRTQLPASERVFVMFVVVLIAVMTYMNGFKGPFYLIYLVPAYNTVLAAWLVILWKRSSYGKLFAGALAMVFLAIQLITSLQHIRADEYHRDYEPAIRQLKDLQAKGKTIVGTSALGFGLLFNGFRDDARVGSYSGLAPDVVVVDRSYRLFAGTFEKTEPKVFEHIATTLTSSYRLTTLHGSFWIFERVAGGRNDIPR